MPKAKKMSGQVKYREKNSSQTAQTASEGGVGVGFQIMCWKLGMEEARFYVQSKGHNAGRPLNSPIPNSWAVFTDIPYLKEIAFSLFKSGKLTELQT